MGPQTSLRSTHAHVHRTVLTAAGFFAVLHRLRPPYAAEHGGQDFDSWCLFGEPDVVYGDGSQTLDFTYIEDDIPANQQSLTDESADGEVLNIRSTVNIDILRLAEGVLDAVDPGLAIEFAERHDSGAEHTHADITKAAEWLGNESTKDIRAGVLSFIEWDRAVEAWYDPLIRSS